MVSKEMGRSMYVATLVKLWTQRLANERRRRVHAEELLEILLDEIDKEVRDD